MAERSRDAAGARRHAPGSPPRRPGTYVLILAAARRRRVRVGALGRLELVPGVYVYVGSARGPGGLAARVGTHRAVRRRSPRWHIDAVSRHTALAEVWFAEDPAGDECEWAALLAASPRVRVPLPRFGASDCRCPSHLFRFDTTPSFAGFRRRARAAAADRAPALRRWRIGP